MASADPRPNFRFRVMELGRIAEADIELRPLTLFVGENNSGKSYLATLIWALHQVPEELFDQPGTPEWEAARERLGRLNTTHRRGLDWLISHSAHLEGGAATDPDPANTGVLALDDEWVILSDALLQRGIHRHLSRVFRAELPEVRLEVQPRPARGFVTAGRGDDGLVWYLTRSARPGVTLGFPGDSPPKYLLLGAFGLASSLPLIGPNMPTDLSRPGTHLYFPASRTGFVQLLPDLQDRLLEGSLAADGFEPLQALTAPAIQFLRFLGQPSQSLDSGFKVLAERVEDQVMSGELRRAGGSSGAYLFRPRSTDLSLPMGRVSAVVSELVPLVRLLRGHRPRLLVYEEPEAHLHPRYQRLVARILTRLMRAGTTVVVTTHSATIAQQFSNALKVGALSADARAALPPPHDFEPYGEEDALRPDDVAAYGFRFREDGRSVVDRLEVTEHGMIMPSFTEELMDLRAEIDRLEDALEER